MDVRNWVKDYDKDESAKVENLEKILDTGVLSPAQRKVFVKLLINRIVNYNNGD